MKWRICLLRRRYKRSWLPPIKTPSFQISISGKVKDVEYPHLFPQAEVNYLHNKNALLATRIDGLPEPNDALEKDFGPARWESKMLRDAETALAQRIK